MRGGLFIGIFLAAAAAFFVLRSSNAPEAPVATAEAPAAVNSVNIYVATQAIPIGTVITPEMVDVQAWPEHLMVSGFVPADGTTNVAGMVARSAFAPQEPIMLNRLANASDPSFLAAALPKGMRVLTINTNETDGLAGFVAAGDRVDVLLTREVAQQTNNDPNAVINDDMFQITETILTNVRVLAVDQKAAAVEPTAADAAAGTTKQFQPPRTVSLMVSPEDARRLRLGEKIGSVSLALRSIEDKDSADPMGVTYIADVSQYRPQEITVTQNKNSLVTVVKGTEVVDKQNLKQRLDLDTKLLSSASTSPNVVLPQRAGVVEASPQ